MKFRAILPVAALATVLSASTSRAEPVDMSTITCGQLATMKADEVTFILTWVMGYSAGVDENLSMDPDELGKTVTDMVTYCTENQEMSVMNAAKEVAAK